VVLAEVYAAGETPIQAADGRALTRALRVMGKVEPVFIESIQDMPDGLLHVLQDGDVLIVMGAGSISGIPGKLAHNQ
jgi:UDP-N-acetylmuramate--alanine ligase